MLTTPYECPECGAEVIVAADEEKVECDCGARLLVDRDGEWFDGMWHDRTTLRKRTD